MKRKNKKNNPVVCVIQARVKSTRLPGKVLKKAAGKALIEHVIGRVKASKHIEKIILATGSDKENLPLRKIAESNEVGFFAGDEQDVLDRFYQALRSHGIDGASTVVRITGDCPLIDPEVVDRVIRHYLKNDFDYVSNIAPTTFPDGLDTEVFSFEALKKAWKEAKRPVEREHVTLFIRDSGKFKTGNVKNNSDLSKERWTVDNPEDFELAKNILEHFSNKVFGMKDILNYKKKNPRVFKVNQHIERNEGLKLSSSRHSEAEGRRISEMHSATQPSGPAAKFGGRSVQQDSDKFKKSQELLRVARRVTPLGAQTYSRSYRYFCEGVAPVFTEKGKDGHVWDIDGNEFIDFILSLGAITVGYNHPEINQAIADQLEKGIIFSQPSPPSIALAEKLTKIIPSAEMVRFLKNGSDATSAAVRLARAFTGKDIIIVSGYHGWQDWYIASTPNHRGIPKDILKYSKVCSYNDLNALKKILEENKGKVAAMIMEPVQSNGPKPGYLEAIKDLLHKHDALLIFDEVVSGFRMGIGGAQGYYGVTPDLSTFGKGMANGMPISCVVGKREILMQIEQGVFISTTFGDELLSIAAALKTIEIIERPESFKYIWRLGSLWKKNVEDLIKEKKLQKVAAVYGLAPHCGIEFSGTPELTYLDLQSVYQQKLIEKGILSLGINNFCLTHTEQDVRQFIAAADLALEDVARAVKAKSLAGILRGGKINPIFKRN